MSVNARAPLLYDDRVLAAIEGVTSVDAARIAGISYRQLDYWERNGIVRASIRSGAGSGTRRAYSRADVIELRICRDLIMAGLSLATAAATVAKYRDVPDVVALVIEGDDISAYSAEGLADRIRTGGYVLTVLPLGALTASIDAMLP